MKTIYINGIIFTGEKDLEEAFVVEDKKIIFVGNNKEALNYKQEKDLVYDLNHHFVCSGFIDSHMHLLNYGSLLMNADLSSHTNSLSEMITYLKQYLSTCTINDDFWLVGRGWNQDYFNDVNRMPTRYDLDKISTTIPICLVRTCGHSLCVNSKALSLLDLDINNTVFEGGSIGVNNNEFDGMFYDNAMEIVTSKIDTPDKDKIKEMLTLASKTLNSYGITSVHSDDYSMYKEDVSTLINEAYEELINENKLTLKVYEQANFLNLDEFKKFVCNGNYTGKGNEFYKIGPLKILGDGSLGSRTAYVSKPYKDDPNNTGLLCLSEEMIQSLVSYANKNNFQIAIHTIGDKCLQIVLDAYKKASNEYKQEDPRHGIVHCQLTSKEQLKEIEALNLHVYAQSIFIDYDANIIYNRVEEELANSSYNWKTLLNNKVHVSNGSDCPVETANVLKGIQCAITRSNLANTTSYLKEQAFSVEEALLSYTLEGAYASFEEHIKGKIKEGYVADFVILDNNPFTCDPYKIKDIKVLHTYLNGKCIYSY